jgi:5-methylcytosine-specific restriction endonuclease McrA
MSTLLLNSDASPVSILPLSILSWQDSIRYLITEKAAVLDWYEDRIVRSEHWETRIPAVMMLNTFQKRKNIIRFSKQNVFLRDMYQCQYCNDTVDKKTATLDHVLPISHGGGTDWLNCTTACSSCNSRKGNNKKIKPKQLPFRPNYYFLANRRMKLGWEVLHTSWNYYLISIDK